MKEDKITQLIEDIIESKSKIKIKETIDFKMKFDEDLNLLNNLTVKEDGKRRSKKK